MTSLLDVDLSQLQRNESRVVSDAVLDEALTDLLEQGLGFLESACLLCDSPLYPWKPQANERFSGMCIVGRSPLSASV